VFFLGMNLKIVKMYNTQREQSIKKKEREEDFFKQLHQQLQRPRRCQYRRR